MSNHARRLPEANLRVANLQPALSRDRKTCTIVQKIAVHVAYIQHRLHSRSLSYQPSCLAVTLHTHSHGLAQVHAGIDISHREIFECVHLKFTVSGWSKQAYTHGCAMQSR